MIDLENWEVVEASSGRKWIGKVVFEAGDVLTLQPALEMHSRSVFMALVPQQSPLHREPVMSPAFIPFSSRDMSLPLDAKSAPPVKVRWASRYKCSDYAERDQSDIRRAIDSALTPLKRGEKDKEKEKPSGVVILGGHQ